MEYLELKDSKGNVITKWPCEWFELNKEQQFACVGGDFTPYGGIGNILADHPQVTAQPIGKVSDQNPAFECQIRNSLASYEWDFDTWPDPEVVLLTIKRKNIK